MKFALILDSPKRDLDGVVLLAYQLALRGAEAYVVPMYQQGYDVPLLRPDGVVMNYARENNRELLAAYRALGIAVMVMDTEGGVLSESGVDSPLNWAREMKRSRLAQCVDRYFFWGPRLRDAFRSESGIPQSALHVTGCPRYDFCSAPWRRLLEFPERDYVLVNTNFSAINPGFTRSKQAEQDIFHQLGWPREYVARLFADLEGVFPRYLDAVEHLARRHGGLRVRVRPHPFEDEAVYRTRFAGLANVVVDGAGNVLPAIANAACVVHLNCGTAVESLMLGTPAVSMEFLNTETMRSHAMLPSEISMHATSLDELEMLAADAPALNRRQRERRPELLRRFVEPWFHHLDGKAAERLADQAIAAIDGRGAPRGSLAASLRGSRAASLGRLTAGLAANLLGSAAAARLQAVAIPARRAKALAPQRVAALVQRLRSIDGGASRVSVRRLRHPASGAPMASLRIARAP